MSKHIYYKCDKCQEKIDIGFYGAELHTIEISEKTEYTGKVEGENIKKSKTFHLCSKCIRDGFDIGILYENNGGTQINKINN